MSSGYEDILYLEHHVSPKRKRMDMADRAAQFSPFAALTGYDAAIAETGRLTDRQCMVELDAQTDLDKKLRLLWEHRHTQPYITLTCFRPDEKKEGGAYCTVSGRVKKVDALSQLLVLEDETWVPFGRILDIRAELFREEFL